MEVGARYLGGGRCAFSVWAPFKRSVSLKSLSVQEEIPLQKDGLGYWRAEVEACPGDLYFYCLDGVDRPDPASRFQPQGVHGPSQVVDGAFSWSDAGWDGISLEEMIIYEIHIGSFTEKGTFETAVPRLSELRDLGVNALEIMPVGQFPGKWNWGYDGVFPFSVENYYGGPEGFKRLVDACHGYGLSVILDVVYNHLGPEGNYLADFGPYFTERYKTPWGPAMNFDGPFSDEVRNFFFENALSWFRDFHVDALRLDAVHAIFDFSAKTFLQELAERVDSFSRICRRFYLIAESDANDARIVSSTDRGGYGIDAMWCDDFHHSLHALLTGEQSGYYVDFGSAEHLAKSLREGFVYSGEYSAYRKRRFGSSSRHIPAARMVVFSQNHDQVGNRVRGERLSSLVSFECLKLAAGAVILSPYLPLIFMGEEYAEASSFLYFVDVSDPSLMTAIRNGRREEMKALWGRVDQVDPASPDAFFRSRLKWSKRNEGRHSVMLDFYRRLLSLRKCVPALARAGKEGLEVFCDPEGLISFYKRQGKSHVLCIMNFGPERSFQPCEGRWKKVLDSSEEVWLGPGSSAPETLGSQEKFDIRSSSIILYLL